MRTDALTIQSWDDIVFENRHKDYGAYAIRQTYNRNITVAILIVSTVTLVACILSRWLPKTSSQEVIWPHTTCGGLLIDPPPIIQRVGNPPKINIPPRVVHDEPIESLHFDGAQNLSAHAGNLPEPVYFAELAHVIDCFPGEIEVPEVITIGCDLLDRADTVTYAPVMPAFIGGTEAMAKWFHKNIRYPASARRDGIQGTVSVSFVVNTVGKVVDVRIVQGIRADCDNEVTRIIKAMPN